MIDTGFRCTMIDESLAHLLGERRGTKTQKWAYFGKYKAGVYDAPPIFAGDVRLVTGDRVYTQKLSNYMADTRIRGILGADCLQRYCLQIDFKGEKIRFLAPGHDQTLTETNAFPLFVRANTVWTRIDLMGMKDLQVRADTGMHGGADLILKEKLYVRGIKNQNLVPAEPSATNRFISIARCGEDICTNYVQTAIATTTAGTKSEASIFSTAFVAGQPYPNFCLVSGIGQKWPAQSWLGLSFFNRHLVTFDFPNGKLYLQRQDWPAAPPKS